LLGAVRVAGSRGSFPVTLRRMITLAWGRPLAGAVLEWSWRRALGWTWPYPDLCPRAARRNATIGWSLSARMDVLRAW